MHETGTMTTPSLADYQPEKNIKEALCPFIGEMVDAILDPDNLANKLYSYGLIPPFFTCGYNIYFWFA